MSERERVEKIDKTKIDCTSTYIARCRQFSASQESSFDNQMILEDSLPCDVTVTTRKGRLGQFAAEQWNGLKKEARELFTFHPHEWANAFRRNPIYPIFQKGDLDGLVALFIDNMATLLTVILILQNVLDDDIIYGKIVPGLVQSIDRDNCFLYSLVGDLGWPWRWYGVTSTMSTWLDDSPTARNEVMSVPCPTASIHQEHVIELNTCFTSSKTVSLRSE